MADHKHGEMDTKRRKPRRLTASSSATTWSCVAIIAIFALHGESSPA